MCMRVLSVRHKHGGRLGIISRPGTKNEKTRTRRIHCRRDADTGPCTAPQDANTKTQLKTGKRTHLFVSRDEKIMLLYSFAKCVPRRRSVPACWPEDVGEFPFSSIGFETNQTLIEHVALYDLYSYTNATTLTLNPLGSL